jgi:membrane fusion protein, multidrug efflux system
MDDLPNALPAGNRIPKALLGAGLGLVVLSAAAALLLTIREQRAEAHESSARKLVLAEGPYVRVARVAVSAAARTVSLPAEVRAFQRATLYAKVSGYLKTIAVDKGDRVRKDQLLATLEAPDIEQQVLAAQADLDLRRQVVKRDRALIASAVVSRQELEQAEAQEKVAETGVARAKAMREYQVMRAPFDGVVTARFADPGALLPAATGTTQAAQPLLEIADLNSLRISLQLGQDDAALVRVGDSVELQLRAEGAPVAAKISRLSRTLDARTRTMLAEVELSNPPEGMYPGAFVNVSLSLKGVPRPLVPAEAILLQNGAPVVPTVEDRKIHFVKVRTGIDDGRTIEILAGLQGGELVALNLASDAREGAIVRPVGPDAIAK